MQLTWQRSCAKFRGGLAQLGEHLLCKQGVNGSIPLSSTKAATETSVKQGCLTLAFEKSNATLFNKTEEGCVTRTDEV